MKTAGECARHNILKVINSHPDDVISIIDIVDRTKSSYPFIFKALKEFGYDIKKRDVLIKRNVYTISKGDIIADRK